jgi:hypothetical protein
MKIGNLQLRGNNSVYAAAFQLLRGRAPAQLRGKISSVINFTCITTVRKT